MSDFKKIAVIGAGTMGSGIAAQIANAGHSVILMDLPRDDDAYAVVNAAKDRLLKSDPPALVNKKRIDLIELANIRDDFDKLAECDWIVEAVVERLDIKKDLYKRLDAVISDDCIVTSNTSTIPISFLVEDMPIAFRKRFAITHYFNPVRYMRLLELVRGADTDEAIMDKLAAYNDEVMGKGVVRCNDTPGFLGNRVGVFALQVGMDEASKLGLTVEEADALMGRPMGIPKTGVFGLYDLIGVDLMSDVVDTLGDILPENDVFHPIGTKGNPVMPLIRSMVADGYTGDKGKGGFYRVVDGKDCAVELETGDVRTRIAELPVKAVKAAEQQAAGQETLTDLIVGNDAQTTFCRRMLGRVFAYAADLVPDVTHSPQDIDDAMKLGFNWVRGPFEMMDALGAQISKELVQEAGLSVPMSLEASVQNGPFYSVDGSNLNVRVFKADDVSGQPAPVVLPKGTVRFHMTKRTMKPVAGNEAASLYELENNLRLIEFHSKANALTGASMEVVAEAAKNHGSGVLVHNDAQHFSAGVDLNRFRTFIENGDWDGMDGFLNDFQQAVKTLKYTPVPVVCAPSGLSIGGGFEVLMHCDKVVAHTNTVFGLVETGVGVVPSGGGVKETLWRWYQATNDWEKASWNTWMQVGYGQIGTSPDISARYQYYLPERDIEVINRDKLVVSATAALSDMQQSYSAPVPPVFELPGKGILSKMSDFMDKGIKDGLFFEHDKTVAMEVAEIVVNSESDGSLEQSEQDLYDRERRAFLTLAKTKETHARIASLLDTGTAVRN
ncbi:3-hydroxyacyl-CoA dehydrogenase [Amylibacter sp. SFDW26]|uniref:3-hydroxyacyl-CoA dehydrogenase/enoyl-CoA hydratase family protein n=1 Tax=Amylibacter sp. SFDW26 TaxID=2652722 RepID=UPI0012625EC8|nr:3-hydroxyacyl-CoA dehydrogenase/enoyl-CoA hydratase family protein [Amylibacter sp. SFDW26]KAB7610040.1 3-hydroxyacyl-CoA dehydrogenase [Amylibacter sp. SFDW26]